MNNPKLGVMSYSFHGLKNTGAMDLFGYLETVKYRYHLSVADIWNGFITSYEDAYIDKIVLALNEKGMTVANLCCDMAHVWDDDPEVRAKNEEMARKCLHLAERIGAKTIRIDVGVRDEKFPPEKLDYVVAKYKEYCAIAAGFGAKLGPENHWGCSRDPESLQRLFDAMADVPNFGLLLHIDGWHSGDFSENNKQFLKYAMHMHMPFEVCCDRSEHLKELLEMGLYDGVWSIESHMGSNEYHNVANQIANVQRVLHTMEYPAGMAAMMSGDGIMPYCFDNDLFPSKMLRRKKEG